MSDKDWNKGRDWGRQNPNMPPPPKSTPDFAAGVPKGQPAPKPAPKGK